MEKKYYDLFDSSDEGIWYWGYYTYKGKDEPIDFYYSQSFDTKEEAQEAMRTQQIEWIRR